MVDESYLYRSFLVDYLTQKNIFKANGRSIRSQKIRYLEKEYKILYKLNPKEEFSNIKDVYTNPEMYYHKIYTLRISNLKSKAKAIHDNHGGYKNKEWRDLRLLVFKRDNNTCQNCKVNKYLHCHHNYYIVGRKLWEYPLTCFSTLCRECHESFHKKTKGSELVIRNKVLLSAKLKEEKESGFIIDKLKFKKQESIFLKNSNKPKLNKIKPKKVNVAPKKDKPETIQQRWNRLIVPQWKIYEFKNKKKKQTMSKRKEKRRDKAELVCKEIRSQIVKYGGVSNNDKVCKLIIQ